MFPTLTPIPAPSSAIAVTETNTPALNSIDAFMHNSWERWSDEANHGCGERRDLAVIRLKDCLRRQTTELDLSSLCLQTLPPHIPCSVTILDVSNNDLDQIESCLLHEGLLTLSACLNPRLTTLPARLPDTLRVVQVAHCDLRTLPESWPPALAELIAHGNPKLLTLPNTLPDSLRIINVSFCSLSQLPERLPPNLDIFLAIHNCLTTSPEILTELNKECFINVMRNPFSEPVSEQLAQLMNDDNYRGPHLYLDFPNATHIPDGSPDTMAILSRFDEQMTTGIYTDSDDEFDCISSMDSRLASPISPLGISLHELCQGQQRPFEDIMATWYPPAQYAEAISAWQPHLSTAAGQEFLNFLNRLCDSINACSIEFKVQIREWLDELLKPQAQALREQTFNVAFEASTRCEDRSTLALIHMQNARVVFDVEQGRYDQTLTELIFCAREMFRQEAIERIARCHLVQEMHPDEVDVYLAFLIKLRTPLQLRWAPQKMAFFSSTQITQAHLDAAEVMVKRHENTDFSSWLCNWEPWNSALARLAPERHQSMQRMLYDALESFETQLTQHLSIAQLSDDGDAQRIGGRTLFEKITLEIKQKTSDDFFAARQLQYLLAPFWPSIEPTITPA